MRSTLQRFWMQSALVVAATSVAAPAVAQSASIALYRMKQDSATLFLGALAIERPVGPGRICIYNVTLDVTQQRGPALMSEKWREERSCTGSLPRSVKTYETLRFGAAPGRYEISAAMAPEGRPTDAKRTALAIESLPANARASDLVLAREIAVVDSTNQNRWTVRHDGIGIAAEPGAHIAAESPRVAFYLEVYGKTDQALAGTLSGEVLDSEGKSMARMDLARINGKGPRTRLAGAVVVAGLAPGPYTLQATVNLADTSFTRSATFTMDAPVVVAQASSSAAYFNALSKEDLALLFDPLAVWLDSKEQRDLYKDLNETGRRQFLVRYFGEAAPGGDPDSRLNTYLARVKHVNDQYTERTGRKTFGWQTDRGRIYLLRGEPANQLKRPFAPNDVKPYEIWAYNVGNQYVYVFVDETRFGAYRLVFSTDPREVSTPDWQNRVGPAVIEELRSQFGIRIQ